MLSSTTFKENRVFFQLYYEERPETSLDVNKHCTTQEIRFLHRVSNVHKN